MSDAAVRRLPLHDRHVALGARFSPFAGWEMPMWYSSIKDEHLAVRQRVGVFDVSHMGEVFVRGPRAIEAVNSIVTNDVSRLADGKALYTVMCRPDGGIVDDLIIYRLAADEVLICVNAGNRAKDFAWIHEHIGSMAEVVDESDAWAQIAIQGPRGMAVAAAVGGPGVAALPPFGCGRFEMAGATCIVARTGYTGEDGVEVYIPMESATAVFDAVMAAGAEFGIQPAGLGCRDSLRLEARLPLYGNDIDDATNPLEAGLGWVVKFDKGEYVGRDALAALKATGPARRYRAFVLDDRAMLRHGYEIFADGQKVGVLTSGSLGYCIGEVPIGTGYIDAPWADRETVDISIRGRMVPARVTTKPFYRRTSEP